MIGRISLSAALLAATCGVSQAATHYVDGIYGSDDDPTTCKKTAPCRTIQKAIDVGGSNSRILVAPGNYPENISVFADRVTIQSLSGRDTTTISGQAESPVQPPVIQVFGDRFTLGGKGRGFLVTTAFDTTDFQSGIIINGDRAKLEHNEINGFDDDDFTRTFEPLSIIGERATVRYNDFANFGFSVFFSAPFPGGRTNLQFRDNEISNIGFDCMVLDSGSSSRDSVRDNDIDGCSFLGTKFIGLATLYTSPTPSARPDIRGNIIRNASTAIQVQNARPSVRNNFVSQSVTGISLEATSGASVKDNHIVNGDNDLQNSVGVRHFAPTGSKSTISGNNFYEIAESLALDVSNEAPYSTISRNNFSKTLDNTCVITFDGFQPAATVKFSGNFWGSDGGPELDGPVNAIIDSCLAGNFELAATSGGVTFTRSADLPLNSRYKGMQP